MTDPKPTAWAIVHRGVAMALAFNRGEAERLRDEAAKNLAPGTPLEVEPLYRRSDFKVRPTT